MIFELDEVPRNRAVMRVIGVGGAGGNAVNRMIDEELEGVEFISANTDAQALAISRAPNTIQIGKRLTQGLGAGARPGVGRQAIAENCEDVRSVLEGADLVFIAAGMGGGTGTGAAPVIGEMARELGALVIAVVTRPFHFEGRKRLRQAEQGIEELSSKVDTVIEVPNEQLLKVVGPGTSFREALKHADEVLLQATKGISDLIRVNGEVNVDFADVRTIMASCGAALLGTGIGRGEDRALLAASEAIESPLLDNISIHGAQGVLLNITGGDDLTIDEVTCISCTIQEAAGDDAEIIFGTVHDPAFEGEVRGDPHRDRVPGWTRRGCAPGGGVALRSRRVARLPQARGASRGRGRGGRGGVDCRAPRGGGGQPLADCGGGASGADVRSRAEAQPAEPPWGGCVHRSRDAASGPGQQAVETVGEGCGASIAWRKPQVADQRQSSERDGAAYLHSEELAPWT